MKKALASLAAAAVLAACLVLLSRCSSPPAEDAASAEQAALPTYPVAVLRIARGADARFAVAADFQPWVNDVLRVSEAKVRIAVTLSPIWVTTPAEIGCTGAASDQDKAMRKAISLAQANGFSLTPYKHLYLDESGQDLLPECLLVGTSGGSYSSAHGTPPPIGVNDCTGLMWSAPGAGAHTNTHEFEHGLGCASVWPHDTVLDLLGCIPTIAPGQPVTQSACEAFHLDSMNNSSLALGSGQFGIADDSPPSWNELVYNKLAWGWVPTYSYAQLSNSFANGAYDFNLCAVEDTGAACGAGKNYFAKYVLPTLNGTTRELYFEYHRAFKINSNDVPGVYINYVEAWHTTSGDFRDSTVVEWAHAGTNYHRLVPLVPVPATVFEAGLTAQTTGCGAAGTCVLHLVKSSNLL